MDENNTYAPPQEEGLEQPAAVAVCCPWYEELGGLRWGQSFWDAGNATFPFAKLRINPDQLEIQLNGWPISTARYTFTPKDVSILRIQRGLFWFPGVRVEHTKPDYPPFILFWTTSPSFLLKSAGAAGFPTG